jgi:hypothetical protein
MPKILGAALYLDRAIQPTQTDRRTKEGINDN